MRNAKGKRPNANAVRRCCRVSREMLISPASTAATTAVAAAVSRDTASLLILKTCILEPSTHTDYVAWDEQKANGKRERRNERSDCRGKMKASQSQRSMSQGASGAGVVLVTRTLFCLFSVAI